MAGETDSTLHDVFTVDPIHLKSYVDRFVELKLANGETLNGTVYTIDPVSQTWILIRKESCGMLSTQLILKHSIASAEICTEVPEDQQNIKTDNIYSNKLLAEQNISAELSLQDLRQQVKMWLSKNMLPVIEDGEILQIDTLEIHPPYGADQCYCDNSIVLSRIQKLLQAMPSNKDNIKLS